MRNLAHARRGFTLIQLLVAVAVIMVLLVLLIPAMSGARKRALLAACANNLRNTGTAIHSYRADHDVLPLAYRGASRSAPYHGKNNDDPVNQSVIYSNATWRDNNWQGLPGLFSPYMTDARVFVCPLTPSTSPVKSFWTGQPSPGTSDDPVSTSSYFYFMGDMGNKFAGNGLGNQFYYYPGTPPRPYDLAIPAKDPGGIYSDRLPLAQDRFYTDDTMALASGNGNGNGSGSGSGSGSGNGKGNENGNGNGNGNGSRGYAYGNHVSSAEWVADDYSSTGYDVGIYRSTSLLVFKSINVLRIDSSVSQMPINELTPVMVKSPGLGNGKNLYGAFAR